MQYHSKMQDVLAAAGLPTDATMEKVKFSDAPGGSLSIGWEYLTSDNGNWAGGTDPIRIAHADGRRTYFYDGMLQEDLVSSPESWDCAVLVTDIPESAWPEILAVSGGLNRIRKAREMAEAAKAKSPKTGYALVLEVAGLSSPTIDTLFTAAGFTESKPRPPAVRIDSLPSGTLAIRTALDSGNTPLLALVTHAPRWGQLAHDDGASQPSRAGPIGGELTATPIVYNIPESEWDKIGAEPDHVARIKMALAVGTPTLESTATNNHERKLAQLRECLAKHANVIGRLCSWFSYSVPYAEELMRLTPIEAASMLGVVRDNLNPDANGCITFRTMYVYNHGELVWTPFKTPPLRAADVTLDEILSAVTAAMWARSPVNHDSSTVNPDWWLNESARVLTEHEPDTASERIIANVYGTKSSNIHSRIVDIGGTGWLRTPFGLRTCYFKRVGLLALFDIDADITTTQYTWALMNSILRTRGYASVLLTSLRSPGYYSLARPVPGEWSNCKSGGT